VSKFVLDASVVLAVANREPGHEGMVQYLLDSAISAVNLSEVVARTAEQGVDIHAIRQRIRGLRLDVVVFDEDLAFQAGCLREVTRHAGLSLGDRACLATARSRGLTAVTADRNWKGLRVGIPIRVVR